MFLSNVRVRRYGFLAAIVAIAHACFFLSVASAEKEPDAAVILANAEKTYSTIKDYVCVIRKRRMVKNELKEEKNTVFKFMKPANYYMKWVEGDKNGTEAIYSEGRYGNKLRAHTGGAFSFLDVTIEPNGPFAMRNERHPITEAGIGFILSTVRRDFDNAGKHKDAVIKYEGVVDGRYVFKGVFPKGNGYYGHEVTIFFDTKNYLPVGIIAYGWEGEFWEEYHYEDMKFNVGLTDKDFDTENPEYGF